ncbi:MAG: 2-phosphosulfolactate phosphatase [Candidatus Eiseniibacteriota bacterium]
MIGRKASLEVLVTPHGLDRRDLSGQLVVVVDVLRACTTIACALDAGAAGVVPAESVEAAARLVGTLDRDTTRLAGERGSVRIEGFHLGNSPGEFTAGAIGGATIVLTTTNGAPALAAARGAAACLAAAFVTCTAAARRAEAHDQVLIVCAGQDGRFSFEDFLAAGMMADAMDRMRQGGYRLDDGARAAREAASRRPPDLFETLRATDHGTRLCELGFEQDLRIAGQLDRFSFVPVVENGVIVRPRDGEEPDSAR